MISFLIPSHNYGDFLKKCVKSIKKNNPKYIKEIIIVNDSSTDNTDLIIKELKRRNVSFSYFKRNFKSLAKTLNFAIKKSKGNILCKIDPDDVVKKNFAEDLGKKFLSLKSDFLYSNIIVNNSRTKKKFIKNQKYHPYLKYFKYPHGSGCLFKKSIWKKVKGLNEKNFYQDDYDFWLKIIKLKRIKIDHYDKALYIYNMHERNMSKNIIGKNFTKFKIFFLNMFAKAS
tara:strand:- start:199 stop:882 length:684 start_codon:yes stop_codon:yes gene_type:complete